MMCYIIITAVAKYTSLDQATSHTTGVVEKGRRPTLLTISA